MNLLLSHIINLIQILALISLRWKDNSKLLNMWKEPGLLLPSILRFLCNITYIFHILPQHRHTFHLIWRFLCLMTISQISSISGVLLLLYVWQSLLRKKYSSCRLYQLANMWLQQQLIKTLLQRYMYICKGSLSLWSGYKMHDLTQSSTAKRTYLLHIQKWSNFQRDG